MIVVVIGAITGGCIWHETGRMEAIGQQYTRFIDHDARMAEGARQIIRLFHQTRYAIYRVIAETEAEQSTGQVGALSAAVTEIADVVHLIAQIAGQTNLLALNATIEAAAPGGPAAASPWWRARSRTLPPRPPGRPRRSASGSDCFGTRPRRRWKTQKTAALDISLAKRRYADLVLELKP